MCSCNPEKVDYPLNTEWGPRVWSILHTLSLRAGSVTMALTKDDEMRAWANVLTATGPMLPCEECRGHYANWLLSHPVKPFTLLPYTEKGEYIRRFFYDLHANVNQRLGKPNLTYSELQATYSSRNVQNDLRGLDELITRALKVGGGTSLLKYKEWLKHIAMLRSVYY